MHKAFNALIAVGCAVAFAAPTISQAQTTRSDNSTPHANAASSARASENVSFGRSLNLKSDLTSLSSNQTIQSDSRITNVSGSSVRGENIAARSAAPATAPSSQAGPVAANARLGVSAASSHSAAVPASLAHSPRAGQSVALMVVGGGALLTGLIIGGDAGTLISVTGVVIGLYGLYNYVK